MKGIYWIFALSGAVLITCLGCKKLPEQPALLQKLSSTASGITFGNYLAEDPAVNIITFEYFYNGAGVGIGDFNKDGLQDIFFSSNQGNCGLFINQGDLAFADHTASSGINTEGKWGTGVSVVDINHDGWLDVYVCFAGPHGPEKRRNSFFINKQDGTFQDQAEEMGLDDTGHSTQAAFFDYDKDGDLDVYLVTNITFGAGPNVIRPKISDGKAPSTDKLFEKQGGKFVEVSQRAGILKEGYGLGIAVRDVNEDGWPDIYVANDYLSNDLLYINQGDGTFIDRLAQSFKHTSYSAMGNDMADINNDGREDLITLDMLPQTHRRRKLMVNAVNYDRHRSEVISGYSPQYMRNTLQLNQGMVPGSSLPVFGEIGQLSGTCW